MSSTTSLGRVVLMMVFVLGGVESAAAQETVTVGLPASVSFAVGTGSSVTGTPNPTEVTFSNAMLTVGHALRLSVIATAATFGGPGGSSYPSTAVSWTVSNASGGSGVSGTLSSAGYTQIFQSNALASSGGFDISWTLTPAGGAEYAGVHTLTLRWKLESVQP